MSEGEDRTTVTPGEQSSPKATLGTTEYSVVAQPYPRLFRQLSEFAEELQAFGEMDADAATLVTVLGERAHAFLKIFIPNLMAEYRFAGFATRAAMDAGELDEQAEQEAPTFPQIIEAVELAFEANGGKRLTGMVGKLLGPELKAKVQAFVGAKLSEALAQGSTSSPLPADGSSPGSSIAPSPIPGAVETPPAPSSMPGPASVDSRSLVSSP